MLPLLLFNFHTLGCLIQYLMIRWLGKIKETVDYFCKTHLLATEKKKKCVERKIGHWFKFPWTAFKTSFWKNHVKEYFLISKKAKKSLSAYHNYLYVFSQIYSEFLYITDMFNMFPDSDFKQDFASLNYCRFL